VKTDDICGSACAEILFLNANHKVIYKSGVVAMHDGPMETSEINKMNISDRSKTILIKANDNFRNFLQKNQIPTGIIKDVPDDIRKDRDNGVEVYWAPKPTDFYKYNITNVIFLNVTSKLYIDFCTPSRNC